MPKVYVALFTGWQRTFSIRFLLFFWVFLLSRAGTSWEQLHCDRTYFLSGMSVMDNKEKVLQWGSVRTKAYFLVHCFKIAVKINRILGPVTNYGYFKLLHANIVLFKSSPFSSFTSCGRKFGISSPFSIKSALVLLSTNKNFYLVLGMVTPELDGVSTDFFP